MPSAIDQFLLALVLPGELKYYATNYMDTPYALRSQRIILPEKVLSSTKLRRYQFLTTPTLSTCGIYVHLPTRLIVVHCEDNGSFVIRKNQYELLDIIIRTQINKDKTPSLDDTGLIDLSSDADKSGMSLSSDDEDDKGAIDVDCLLRELKILEEDNKITIPLELKFAKKINPNPSHQFIDQFNTVLDYTRPVPLLPIYIGILDNRRDVIIPLNYNEKYYRADIVLYKQDVVFYQKFYTSISTKNVIVTPLGENNEALPKPEVLIDHLLEVERILRANNDHVLADRDDIVTKIMYYYQQVYPKTLRDRSSSVSSVHFFNISTPSLPQPEQSLGETQVKQTPVKHSLLKETPVTETIPLTPLKKTPLKANHPKLPPLKGLLLKKVSLKGLHLNETSKDSLLNETPPKESFRDTVSLEKDLLREHSFKDITSTTRYENSPEIVGKVKLFNNSNSAKHTPVVPNINGRANDQLTSPSGITQAAQSIKLIYSTNNFDSFDSSSASSSPSSSLPLPLLSNEDVEDVPDLHSKRSSEDNITKETREADMDVGNIEKPDFISPLSSSQSDSISPSDARFSKSDSDSKKVLLTKISEVPSTALGIKRKLQFEAPVRQLFSELNTPTKRSTTLGDPRSIVNRMELKNIINQDLNSELTQKKNSVLEVEQSRIISSSSQSESQLKSQFQFQSPPQPPNKVSEVIYSSNSTEADKIKSSQESGAQQTENAENIIPEDNGTVIEVLAARTSRSQLENDQDKDNSIEHSQVIIPGDMLSQATDYLVRRYMENNEDDSPKSKKKYKPLRSRRLRSNR